MNSSAQPPRQLGVEKVRRIRSIESYRRSSTVTPPIGIADSTLEENLGTLPPTLRGTPLQPCRSRWAKETPSRSLRRYMLRLTNRPPPEYLIDPLPRPPRHPAARIPTKAQDPRRYPNPQLVSLASLQARAVYRHVRIRHSPRCSLIGDYAAHWESRRFCFVASDELEGNECAESKPPSCSGFWRFGSDQ